MSREGSERLEGRYAPGLLPRQDLMLLGNVRDFVEREIIPVRKELEAGTRGGFREYEEMLAAMVPLGLYGCSLPEEYGGGGMTSALTLAALAEELGRGDASLGMAVLSGCLALRPAVRADNREVLEAFSSLFCGGDPFTGALALYEEEGCGDLEDSEAYWRLLATRARGEEGGWVLDGRKDRVTNAGRAGVFCVACREEGAGGEEAIALVYTGCPAPGLRLAGERQMAGLRGARYGDIELKGLKADGGFRAAGPGRDAELLRECLALARLLACALAVGTAQGALEEALDFTRERPAAGKPIRQHGVCAALLADAASVVQAARDCYAAAAARFDRGGEEAGGESRGMLSRASLAYVFCCRAAVDVTNRCMELMGSYGYVSDYHIEKYWRDAKALQLSAGGAQAARLDAARGLYPLESFCRNELYEEMQRRRG